MAKRKKESTKKKVPVGDNAATLASPFAGLAGLRDTLPSGGPEGTDESQGDERSPHVVAHRVSMNIERTGRGGKTVTIVHGVLLEGQALEHLLRDMKKSLGISGHLEDGRIVVGGDQRDRLKPWFESQGVKKA